MELLFLSFLAGILTILSPCVLPVLPIVIGGSLQSRSIRKPLIIIVSLGFSLFLFSLLLKASTLLLSIDPKIWTYISGGIILLLGVITLFPQIWEKISVKLNFSSKSNQALQESSEKGGVIGEVLTGLALGPVFSSCSPTYSIIIATVIPVSLAEGMVYLLFYVLGLSLMMLLIALFGQKLVSKLKWAVDPKGWFKKVLGILFVVIGLSIITGVDKDIESYLIEKGLLGTTEIEMQILERTGRL